MDSLPKSGLICFCGGFLVDWRYFPEVLCYWPGSPASRPEGAFTKASAAPLWGFSFTKAHLSQKHWLQLHQSTSLTKAPASASPKHLSHQNTGFRFTEASTAPLSPNLSPKLQLHRSPNPVSGFAFARSFTSSHIHRVSRLCIVLRRQCVCVSIIKIRFGPVPLSHRSCL